MSARNPLAHLLADARRSPRQDGAVLVDVWPEEHRREEVYA
jgi:hypothetical protein